MRGAPHRTGEWLFTIDPQTGIVVLPVSMMTTRRRASDTRVLTGIDQLDRMCGGGLYRDSITFVRGHTGTGKTLVASHFAAAAVSAGERCAFFSFEESSRPAGAQRRKLGPRPRGDGGDRQPAARVQLPRGRVQLEDHLLKIRREIEQYQPRRLVVDNLSALERVAPTRAPRHGDRHRLSGEAAGDHHHVHRRLHRVRRRIAPRCTCPPSPTRSSCSATWSSTAGCIASSTCTRCEDQIMTQPSASSSSLIRRPAG